MVDRGGEVRAKKEEEEVKREVGLSLKRKGEDGEKKVSLVVGAWRGGTEK